MDDGSVFKLLGCTDAQTWADEWLKITAEIPGIPKDRSTMVGWFANAIMSGYDKGVKHEKERNLLEKVHEIVFQAVGAGTGVMLRDNPEYVFPAEEVSEVVKKVLSDHGIPNVEGY
jgi:hypothetical protein